MQPESAHTTSDTRSAQARAVPLHLLPAQRHPSTLTHAAEVVAVLHFVGVPEQASVGVQPFSPVHCWADSVEHAATVPLHTGAPPAPALAGEPAVPPEPAMAAPPEPAWLVVPPLPAMDGAPASPPTLLSPALTLIAPASLPPPLSFEAPAAPAVSLLELPARPASPDGPKSLLEPPQLTVRDRAHGTSQTQEDFFMPYGWQKPARFYYRGRS
jgi:hypothetical protein